MRLGLLAEGYIYPKADRAVRDLLRRRSRLVQQRTASLLAIQNPGDAHRVDVLGKSTSTCHSAYTSPSDKPATNLHPVLRKQRREPLLL